MLGKYISKIIPNVVCIPRHIFDILKDDWNSLDNIITSKLKENDVIINCSGLIPQKRDESNIKEYIKINTLFPFKLSEIASKYKYNLIHITTDCVFDGSKGLYDINDLHTSNTVYGITKSLGELSNDTVIRTSIIGEDKDSNK